MIAYIRKYIRLKLLLLGIIGLIFSIFIYRHESKEYRVQQDVIHNGEQVSVILTDRYRERLKTVKSFGYLYFVRYRHQKENRTISNRVQVSKSFYRKFQVGNVETLIISDDYHSEVFFPSDHDHIKSWFGPYIFALFFILGGSILILVSNRKWLSNKSLGYHPKST